jgi:hypothetical protein
MMTEYYAFFAFLPMCWIDATPGHRMELNRGAGKSFTNMFSKNGWSAPALACHCYRMWSACEEVGPSIQTRRDAKRGGQQRRRTNPLAGNVGPLGPYHRETYVLHVRAQSMHCHVRYL